VFKNFIRINNKMDYGKYLDVDDSLNHYFQSNLCFPDDEFVKTPSPIIRPIEYAKKDDDDLAEVLGSLIKPKLDKLGITPLILPLSVNQADLEEKREEPIIPHRPMSFRRIHSLVGTQKGFEMWEPESQGPGLPEIESPPSLDLNFFMDPTIEENVGAGTPVFFRPTKRFLPTLDPNNQDVGKVSSDHSNATKVSKDIVTKTKEVVSTDSTKLAESADDDCEKKAGRS